MLAAYVIQNAGNGRCWRGAAGNQFKTERVGRVADVTRRVLGLGRQVMGAVGQRWRWGERPVTCAVYRCTADLHAVVVDDHGAARLGFALDFWLGVVGHIACIDRPGHIALVINHAGDFGLERFLGVDDDGVGI